METGTTAPTETATAWGMSCRPETPEDRIRQKYVGERVYVWEVAATPEEATKLATAPEYPARVIGVEIGAHWSDQPNGRSGYHLGLMVEVPDALRGRTIHTEGLLVDPL